VTDSDESKVEARWEEIWNLLQEERTEEAVALALQSLNDLGDQVEFRFLLGIALMDAGEVEAAVPELETAVEMDAEWADAHAALAWSLFRCCRFDDAARANDAALALDPDLADAHQLRGLLTERAGDADASVVAFAHARRLDPERFTEPYPMDEDEFLEVAREAVAELDEKVLTVLEETAFFVQDFPSDELLRGTDPPLDPQILGLFVGRSLLEQSVDETGTLPNAMFLFQRNLEREATSRQELEDEIRITVLHEIAHHFGWNEEELEARGFA
jgi:predicted Zn-dependent protease with MMP-like domain